MPRPDRIGRHRVETLIGSGGFALVYRAHDEFLQDTVAIKVLAEQWATDADVRRRFLDEARILRRTGNQYLVTVHDIGELEDGRPYFVMDYANRGNLADRLAKPASAGLDAASARVLAETMAGGLGALHRAGVVHRDVNPRNLFLKDKIRPAGRKERAAAPTNIGGGLIAETERLLIGDLGLAKDVVLSASPVSVLGGTPGYQAPEQTDPEGEVQPATDIFAATSVVWEAITGRRPPAVANLAGELSAVDDRWRPVFERGLAADPSDRFPDTESWLAAVLEAVGEVETGPGRAVLSKMDQGRVMNPYQGLAAFQPEDARRFFGRDTLVQSLVERLTQERVLVVGGASGSGKSSLVRAGLIPAVASGALHESRRWPIALFTPRAEPLKELAYQLERAAGAATQREVAVSASDLREDPSRARTASTVVTDAAGGMLLVVDQFEELFTQSASRESQEVFLEVLSEMVDPVDSRVRLVIVMRADFYAQSALFTWLAERINRSQVLVGPMTPPELRRAIEGPVHQTGMHVEPELIDAVLDEAHGDPGALPLVSHAMAETWRRRKGASMTLAAYRHTGGVAGAISQTAESVYSAFDAEEKMATRHLLLRLVTPGEGASDTRLALPLKEVDSERAPIDVRRVAEALIEARLLTADKNTITIAHEALIGSWPRLREWIEESRDDLRTRQRITAAAYEWDEQSRDPDLLYRGTPLSAALEWAKDHRPDLGALAAEFLAESEAAYLRKVEAEAAAEKRSRRLRTGTTVVLAVLLSIASVASVVAFNSFQEANLRLANQLATQASELTAEDPRLALALAVEAAVRGAGSFELRLALVDGTQALEDAALVPARSPMEVGDALTVAIHPDGAIAAIGSRQGGDITLLDLATGSTIGSPLAGHAKPVIAIAFTPDGERMLSAGQDGVILVWELDDPGRVPEPAEVGRSDDVFWDVDVAADGNTAASAGEDGVIQLWDIESRTPLGEPLIDSGFDSLTVQFSPDARFLLGGNGQGELMGWDLATREPIFAPFNAHGSDIWEIVFSPDGGSVATASSDGKIRLWDLSGSMIAEPFRDEANDVRGAQFLGGGLLAAGDENGRVRVWDLAANEQVLVSQVGHRGQVIVSSLSSDASTLLTLGLDHNVIQWTSPMSSGVEMAGHVDGAFGLAVSPDGSLVATGDRAGDIRLFTSESGRLVLGPLDVHDEPVWALSFSADGRDLISGDTSGALASIDPRTGEVLRPPQSAHDGAIRSMAVAEDLVLSGGDDGVVRAWNEELEPVGDPLGPHVGGVTGMAVSTEGTLAVSDRSGLVHFWDPEDAAKAAEPLQADDNTIWGLDWSPDGQLLATASDNWAAFVWNVSERRMVANLTTLPEGGTAVGFLDDGKTVVATSRDGSVRLFDIELGREIGSEARTHGAPAWGLEVFPDGFRYTTSAEDGTVRVWDALDLDRACERSAGAFDEEQQRRYLGEPGAAVGCR
jgi:WD40 repeat protein/serine/threonine protein kinase